MATSNIVLDARPRWRGRTKLFYPGFALAVSVTAFTGFFFTYFGPIFGGTYPAVAPAVHVHGWSFFFWYLLIPLQAVLLANGRTGVHMMLGRLSLALAAVMVVTGLFVLSVRMDMALAGAADGFSAFLRANGPLVLSSLLLFALFYAAAIGAALKGRMEAHKRLMVLASSAALGAALFRIFVVVFGPVGWASSGWALATNLFILAGMIHDKVARGAVHHVYWVGLAVALGVELLLWPFPGNPMINLVGSTLAALGAQVEFLY